MQKATQRMSKGLRANKYGEYNYVDMINRCDHLDKKMKSTLMNLFIQYKELFSRSLGKVLGVKVKLSLKNKIASFHSRPYFVPQAFEALAKKSRSR